MKKKEKNKSIEEMVNDKLDLSLLEDQLNTKSKYLKNPKCLVRRVPLVAINSQKANTIFRKLQTNRRN